MARSTSYVYQYSYPISRLAVSHRVEVDVYMTGPRGRTVVLVQRNGSETMTTWRARSVQETLWHRAAGRAALATIDQATAYRNRYLDGSQVHIVGAGELEWEKKRDPH